jgi:YHS domain-containing protein
MVSLKQKEFNTSSRLIIYASGSGALSFTFRRDNEAISEKVTKADVRQFLKRKENKRFQNRIIINDSGYVALANPVKRINSYTLEMGGKEFYYSKQNDKNEFTSYNTNFNTEMCDGEVWKVQHLSTISELLYFLNNEEKFPV